MNPGTNRILVPILVLALGGVGFALFRQTGENMTFYYNVDEVTPDKVGDDRIKLSGNVAKGSISREAKTQTTRFHVAGTTTTGYDVVYTGPVPDIFGDGIQVVVTGSFTDAGMFEADELLAKCPSKYEAEGSPADFAHLSATAAASAVAAGHPAGLAYGAAAAASAPTAPAPPPPVR